MADRIRENKPSRQYGLLYLPVAAKLHIMKTHCRGASNNDEQVKMSSHGAVNRQDT